MQLLADADPAALAATARTTAGHGRATAPTPALRAVLRDSTRADCRDGKLHMVRPLTDPAIPWTALVVGLWIPNFFYWGLNQYITQRTLGSKSLAEGQRGIVFAAFLKLLIPFVVVIPGILAFNLFSTQLVQDQADRKNKAAIEGLPGRRSKWSSRSPPTSPSSSLSWPTQIYDHNAAVVGVPIRRRWLLSAELPSRPERRTSSRRTRSNGAQGVPKLVGYDFDAAFPTLIRNCCLRATRHQGLCPGGDLRRGGQLARRHAQFGFDHLRDGHLPQAQEGRHPVPVW